MDKSKYNDPRYGASSSKYNDPRYGASSSSSSSSSSKSKYNDPRYGASSSSSSSSKAPKRTYKKRQPAEPVIEDLSLYRSAPVTEEFSEMIAERNVYYNSQRRRNMDDLGYYSDGGK